MIKNLMNSRMGLQVVKNSPEILIILGIGGIVGSTVMACKATLKADEVLDRAKGKLDRIKSARESIKDEGYTPTEYKRDLAVTYVQTGAEFIKLYGPAMALGAVSIGCLLGSHKIMKGRNVALMAAYKVVEEGFNAYRARVVDEYGERKDYLFKHGLYEETVTELEVGEDGKSKKVKIQKIVHDKNRQSISPYSHYYNETCTQWSPHMEYNLMYLRQQQNYWNDMLKVRGHVFLNEVYDALGILRSPAASVVGWVVDGNGDNYIDFGIFTSDGKTLKSYAHSSENGFLLDFNVDGVIYDLI